MGEGEHVDGDELSRLLASVQRIADGVGAIQEIAIAIAQRPDPPAPSGLRRDDESAIRELRQQVDLARRDGAVVTPVHTGTIARLLDVVNRLQRAV